ncbi:MAG: hypothetical protein EXQ56_07665 [Acidobacteria bacterium]|nr:hypothetical protein [Acidobacteriota bacterium]
MMMRDPFKLDIQNALERSSAATTKGFPPVPAGVFAAHDFAKELVAAAICNDPRFAHPFLRGIANGTWSRAQLREWARHDYAAIIVTIRRHTLAAANCEECDLLRSLLGFVGIEADADPVGGAFFSLPQLWVKFGISLGLTRDEMIHFQPHPQLRSWNERALSAARASTEVPVTLLIDSMVTPGLHLILGEALQRQLGLPRDALDFFWAAAGNRWGEEVAWPILEGWCSSPAAQASTWKRYCAERERIPEHERLSILQAILQEIVENSPV